MITSEDFKTKTAQELISQTASMGEVLDAMVEYIKTLQQRIETLENK